MSHVANLLHVQTIHLCHHSILVDAKSIEKLFESHLGSNLTISKMIQI